MKIITMFFICTLSVFLVQAEPQHIKFNPATITPAEVNKLIADMPEDGYVEVSLDGLLCVKAWLETNPKTYDQALTTVKSVINNSKTIADKDKTAMSNLVTQQMCFNMNTLIPEAYSNCTFPWFKVRYLVSANKRSKLPLTTDEAYTEAIGILLENDFNSYIQDTISQFINMLPLLRTITDEQVVADLKRLNRKYSRLLVDPDSEKIYKPIVTLIRVTIETY